MDIKAFQLEARFSLPPNSLGYCGRDTAAEKFKQCIINGECGGVEKEVTKFIVLYPYLETIAGITKLPVFSYEVIESYWIGNDLLKKAKSQHYDLLLKNFERQGVPDFFVKELKEKPPKVFIPNHLFQVLHVGVGRASGSVPFNLESINNCMIRWGEVVRLDERNALINLHSLESKNKTHIVTAKQNVIPDLIGDPENSLDSRLRGNDKGDISFLTGYNLVVNKETVSINTNLVPGLKTGNVVAVHWNRVVKILTKDEEEKLKYWTKQCLVLF